MRKPGGSATVMGFAGKIVIRPRVWWRQPTSKLLLQLVAYKVVSSYKPRNRNVSSPRTFHLIDFHCYVLHNDWQTTLRTDICIQVSETHQGSGGYRRSMHCHLRIRISYHESNYTRGRCAPPITTSILLTSPQTTSRVWATVILDSSPVSRSRRWRTDSISFSPRSFFAYFSTSFQ